MQNGWLKKLLPNEFSYGLGMAGSVILMSISISCHKSKGSTPTPPACPEFAFPNAFIIEIKENGKYVSDSNYLTQLKLINGSNQEYVNDFTASAGIPCSDGLVHRVVTTVNAPLSSAYGTKYFYLLYPDGTKDTIYLDIVRTPATNCEFVQDSLLFNGIRPTTDSLLYIDSDSTYVLNHQ